MYNVPTHIKTHVDRIIQEYDDMYRRGHKIALQILRGNKLYSGLETTEYYLKEVYIKQKIYRHSILRQG